MKKEIESPYMRLNRVEFVVTERCNGRCRHCQAGGTLNRGEGPACVDARAAADMLARLCAREAIASVMTFGGEPMLYPEAVVAIHAAATACGVGTRQLITNGCFARDAAKQADAAARLHAAGVNSLLISVDGFHQETVPLEPVAGFARAVAATGIPGARLYPAWLVGPEADNPYDARTRDVLAAFEGISLPIDRENRVYPAGSALEYLSDYFDPPTPIAAQRCGDMPYTDPLTAVTSLTIMPNGDAMVCGFLIGNIYREDILTIVDRYDPHADPCMCAVMAQGAEGLLEHARVQGIAVDASRCRSVCDLCHMVARR